MICILNLSTTINMKIKLNKMLYNNKTSCDSNLNPEKNIHILVEGLKQMKSA